MKNADLFLKTMQEINPEVEDHIDAIEFAMQSVPLVDEDVWFGDIENRGTYFANSRESRWYPMTKPSSVAKILAEDML